MILVEATPKTYLEKGTFTIPEHKPSRGATFPVIAGGRLFLRDNNWLFCYDVREEALKEPRSKPKLVELRIPTKKPREKVGKGLRSVFVSTPHDVVERMLELAEVNKLDVVHDLGSGDGRIVIAAARKYGSRAIGYEIDKELVTLSREQAAKAGVVDRVTIEHGDIFKVDLHQADVIAVYLLPEQLEKLIPQLKKLKPGSRIVSHQFQIPGVKPDKTIEVKSAEDGDGHTIHLWTAPLVTSQ
jgi:tRNA G37 N-methylase Trm5